MTKSVFLSILCMMFIMISCDDNDNPQPSPDSGKISFQFQHHFDGYPVAFDTLQYVNEAGNQIMFSEIQYFISDVSLHYTDGSIYRINKWKEIHYVDSDILSTQTWEVYDSIPAGNIDSISFTFGINEEKNQSFMYVNPPESLMFWPDILGGGYHYLKLNGKWLNEEQQLSPFNFHLGIGQIYNDQGEIIDFVQNYFTTGAKLPVYSSYLLTIKPGQLSDVAIVMNLESWFEGPNTWDFNFWGGDIMQNQSAMHTGCENGKDAFTLSAPLYPNK